jgi:myo-inositol-1(or 4)-monophosphatase
MNLEALLQETRAVAGEAGEVLMGFLGKISTVQYKGRVDLVTEADRASEALLVERLSRLLPEASVLAEEGSGIDRGSATRWIVDPLDGTTNFAHAYPIFCVSIALERDGDLLLAVVHDPTRKDFFTAVRGGGANLAGRRIRVSRTRRLDRSLLVTGFPYDVQTNPRNNLPQFARFLKTSRAVRRDGSAALNLAYVAAGRFDGFWEEGLAPWDIAAGILLIEEAGGRTSDYRGGPFDLDGGNLVATNGRIHAALLEALGRIEETEGLPPLETRRR